MNNACKSNSYLLVLVMILANHFRGSHGFQIDGSSSSTISCLYATGKTLEVCLSPGCVADGAQNVLSKLEALESSCEGVIITRGVCCSLCGSGPIAREPGSGRKHRRITSNNKILRLLSSSDTYLVNPNQETVLESIDFCSRGDEDLRRKNYKGAIQLYAKALETGMKAAIALNNENENENNTLQWVINALCNEAYCKFQIKDVVGTIVSAKTAYQMSKKKSSESLEVLQEVYESIKEENKELEALEALFLLYEQQEEEDKVKPMRLRKRLSPMELGKRRSLGFRLSKLQTSLH